MKFMKISYFAVLLLVLGFMRPITAQDPITITITGPLWMGYMLDDPELYEQFETQNPGIQIAYVDSNEDIYESIAKMQDDPAAYFDMWQNYVSTADLLFLDDYMMPNPGSISTAGFLLNLRPLIETDNTLNPSDFYTAAWEAFQWDGSIWALPVTANARFLVINPAKFDEAGLPYPNRDWTFESFANAVRALAERDANGELVLPGFLGSGLEMMLLTQLMGVDLYDTAAFPAAPRLDQPEVIAFLDAWYALEEEGIINPQQWSGGYDEVPMRFDGRWALIENNFFDETREPIRVEPAQLPQAISIVNASGFGISAGTQHPEAAYAVLKFMTEAFTLSQYGSGDPARRDVTVDLAMFGPPLSPEKEAFLEGVLDNGTPMLSPLYGSYLMSILDRMRGENLDAATATAEIQAEAMRLYQMASERAQTTVIEVAPPPAPPQLAEGEISISFGIGSFGPVLPNRDMWDAAVADFVADDPQVGFVDLKVRFNPYEDTVDCFYESYNRIQDSELSEFLNIDPFLDADPNFNRDDFLGNVLGQAQRDGRTWGYPLTLHPMMMGYSTDVFNMAGVPLPTEGWTGDQFAAALNDLYNFNGEPAFQFWGGGSDLMMFIAAYGGLPYDYRENPPTINFSDPEAMAALRQVLDLVRDGVIAYESPDRGGGGGGDRPYSPPAIFLTSVGTWLFDEDNRNPDYPTPGYTTFPRSNRYTPISYNIGVAHINAQSLYPEACYRWITHLAQRPELMMAMPVQASLLTDADLMNAQGQQMIDLYTMMGALIDDPAAVNFAHSQNTPTQFIEYTWLQSVINDYISEENPIDLEGRLIDAQAKAETFRECVSDLPPFQPPDFTPPDFTQSQEEIEAYYEAYFGEIDTCGVAVDPDYQSPFNPSP